MAVILVVVYHASVFNFNGGFLGVDVFFVISGYLINLILLTKLSEEKFDFQTYLIHRIKRIAPALLVTLICTLPIAYHLMPPRDLEKFSIAAISSALFASNYIFAETAGYFGGPSELNPLIHTWSLSVEFQLYLIFGLAALMFRRAEWHFRFTLIVFVLSLCYFLLNRTEPSYFSTLSRMWEFALGGLVAYFELRRPARGMGFLAVLAIGGIGYSAAFSASEMTVASAMYTLLVCFSSAIFIRYAAVNNVIRKLFSLPPIVLIGTISYSIYLIHQPIFVFARMASISSLSIIDVAISVSSVLILAYLSYSFVERPFIQRDRFAYTNWSVAAISVILFIGIFAWQADKHNGFYNRYSGDINSIALADREKSHLLIKCGPPPSEELIKMFEFTDANLCHIGDSSVETTTVIWGDSHARMYGLSLDRMLKEHQLSGLIIAHGGCPPILSVGRSSSINDRCATFNKLTMNYLIEHKNITHIVVGGRLALYLHGRYDNGEGGAEYGHRMDVYPIDEEDLNEERVDAVLERLKLTIDLLLSANKKIVLLYPAPEVGYIVPTTLMKVIWRGGDLTHSYTKYQERQSKIISVLDSMQGGNVFKIRPDQEFCDKKTKRCIVHDQDHVFYYDDNHLSVTGTERVLRSRYSALLLFLGIEESKPL